MSAVRDIIAALIGSGMEAADAAALLARAGTEMATGPSKGALRTRRWRENRPSQTVTGDASVTPDPTPNNATENRHKPSHVTLRRKPLLLTYFLLIQI